MTEIMLIMVLLVSSMMMGRSMLIRSFSLKRTKFVSKMMADTMIEPLIRNGHVKNNVPDSVIAKIGKNLHLQQNHPLNIIKKRIESYCNEYASKNNQTPFRAIDNQLPVVSTKSCFDDLRVAPDHVSRRPTDTYYVDDNTVLRTHTSAHQTQFLRAGERSFLCTGDVYRRDEIDASHYPVFHQMEGVRIFEETPAFQAMSPEERTQTIVADLKGLLTGLAYHLFGQDITLRWNDEYFPFTTPSFELEVLFEGRWLEVLGCGVIHPEVMANSGRPLEQGWAFGLGLERLAMVLFAIPDIRLFWSEDDRFLSQFEEAKAVSGGGITFQPYSKYPSCYKDVSFWLPGEDLASYHINDVYELIRSLAGDIVEKVEKFDEFVHPKTGRTSQAFRITYRHMDRSLTNEETNELQEEVRRQLTDKLKVTLR